ncbi:electron-transferring-flavoprotein dehydrogenase [Candidatus Kinetoplastibacterium blastocrithidii TCC012E]|uniref:Electron transfer flavoprotein-ubiquinone oxidoreductase n=5 Tax=cellular organisms TaxID=131567 RepID=S9V066_9TRYP|nr:electron transfer flavoprotein-ubiquinone oxidoreductase [Candidatus Kinetoplastibacterium blastocrithidii]AFZ83750.1 electron-transferring-flavoprotein dehydrogenase [Candidatus Kinetoplastibacterium blastocrithidii (ex Strigomonas culicis)]AGF49873.1 electron-transferring-flavoprotein dehydrogenase [Candidatus Kinetoplastibacterium blastocrithidii TCC012E]EPY20291.1 electron-transferring-flavoprotein dehydrogenase [Strigomonas culicis]EPY20607.1 electron-transferring-flavoprotein dehydroge|eukprot:EPY20291.1 electron-transferring-flavoprotein dehydrogenase [Strigomonas culicis]
MHQEESVYYDVIIVGAGPSGISAGIKLKQLAIDKKTDIKVCIIEKSLELGDHILSGAIVDIKSIRELLPNFNVEESGLFTAINEEKFLYLKKDKYFNVPNFLLPNCLKNNGCYLTRLGHLVKWMGNKAEELGVDVFTGFAATNLLYNSKDEVCGITTGSFGLDREGNKTSHFQAGLNILSKHTVLAEGSRGSLGKKVIEHFNLDKERNQQRYSIGIKEIWEIDHSKSNPGLVVHTIGWPLDDKANGGAFLYNMDKDLVSVGMVIDLNYSNPWLSPFEEFQSYKTHPVINNILENGKRLSYGAKSITMGGLLSLPKLCFKGGILIGCDAGFLNSSRLKGIHTAIESGIIAAESIIESMLLDKNTVENNELVIYTKKIKASGLYKELNKSRNFKQWSNKYKIVALLMIVLEQKIFRGHFFWNLYSKKSDNESLKPAIFFDQIIYQKPNYKTTFDIDSSVFLSNTRYEKNEPVHLKINNSETPILINLKYYAGPEARYCPAGVYNFIKDENGNHKLHVNSENCIHCKTCDIKDITQNITWETPQGGSGPAYNGM